MNKNRMKIKYSLIVLWLISVLTFTVICYSNKTNNEVISKDFELTLEAAKVGVQAEIDNIAIYKQFLSYGLPKSLKYFLIPS